MHKLYVWYDSILVKSDFVRIIDVSIWCFYPPKFIPRIPHRLITFLALKFNFQEIQFANENISTKYEDGQFWEPQQNVWTDFLFILLPALPYKNFPVTSTFKSGMFVWTVNCWSLFVGMIIKVEFWMLHWRWQMNFGAHTISFNDFSLTRKSFKNFYSFLCWNWHKLTEVEN